MVSSPQRLNMYKKTIKGVDYHIYENEDEFRKHHRKEEVKTRRARRLTTLEPYWVPLLQQRTIN